jgi:hypothetical protein|tara:strand:+ start:279 stop:992 length:714 start_codon:yes stop_codon:yes gene_type:complete
MIKTILLILITLPNFILGQEEEVDAAGSPKAGQYKWEIGINGGVNITNVSGFKSDSTGATLENNIGRLYGITLVYHLNKVFAIKTDIDFENKGWTVKNFGMVENSATGIDEIVDVTQNLNYFDIPAFLHIGFGNKLKFDLNFGPYVAFLIDNKTTITDGDGVVLPESDVALGVLPEYSATDFGITYGAGIDLALGKRVSFGFDLLYEQGLKDITADGLRNTSIDFDFGINILFGEKK